MKREPSGGAAAEEAVGTPDTVSCGPGKDRAIANRNDTVANNCEKVTRVANPQAGAPLGAAATARAESVGNR